MLAPTRVTARSTDPDDPRVGHLLAASATEQRRIALIGFGCERGIELNGGRPGAAAAPEAIRRVLYNLTPDARDYEAFVRVLGLTEDRGDVMLSGDLQRDQEALAEVVANCLERGVLPIILGGGHETSYGHFLGYAKEARPVSIVNFDAHTDVRPMKQGQGHSGSPFRQALEHPSALCQDYTVVGLSPWSVARVHVAFIEQHAGHIAWLDSLNAGAVDALFRSREQATMTTFCMDAVDQSDAPGVSAPSALGLSKALWLHAAYRAGACEAVSSIDLVEVSPGLDQDLKTVRLAALTVWTFLRGLAQRSALL